MEELGRSLDHKMCAEYKPEKPAMYPDLLDTEIGRLQRAFCHLEIYCRLFARCSPHLNHEDEECLSMESVSDDEQARLYLQRLPDYEIVEINCIRDYFHRRLRGILSELEDDAAENLRPLDMMFGQIETDLGVIVESENQARTIGYFAAVGKCTRKNILSIS